MLNITKLRDLLKDEVVKLGYKLVQVGYVEENGEFILKCIVDRDKPISVDDIEEVTHVISDKLDTIEKDMPDSYILNVESLGDEGDIDLNDPDDYQFVEEYAIEILNQEVEFDGTVVPIVVDLIDSGDGKISIKYAKTNGFMHYIVIDKKDVLDARKLEPDDEDFDEDDDDIDF